jgi:kinesin family member 18/19
MIKSKIASKVKTKITKDLAKDGNKDSSSNLRKSSMVNELENGQNNIMVCVRVRPESNSEKTSTKRTKPVVKVVDEHVLVFDPSDDSTKNMTSRERIQIGAKKGKDIQFAFDRVFSEKSTQVDVFENSTKFLLPGVLNGFNATVFAHGATGSGKTHTMLGDERSGPGVLVLTIIELFSLIENSKNEKEYKIHISYLEVYNEQIRDLLVDKSKVLDLRCDSKKGMVVSGLSEHHTKSVEETLDLLSQGNKKRVQFETAMNSQSSRSHAVFQIFVEQTDRTKDIKASVKFGKLSLIDLAGNERASQTKNVGKRLQEGANINKSLLALGNCINALCKATTNSKVHIPYRDSKLTRLLQDSLGGNCRTVMIATVSPSSISYEDSFNTLKYSDRAKMIKTKVERNELNVKYHISEYNNIISDLRNEISDLKSKLEKKDKQVETSQLNQFEKQFEEMEKSRSDLLNSFDQQIDIRKKIMDNEEEIRKISFEILKKNSEINLWEREHPYEALPLSHSTRDIKSFLKSAEICYQSNVMLQIKLKENISKCKYLEEKISTKFLHPQLSLIIQHDIKLHDGVVQRLDLERSLKHRMIMEQRLSLLKESTKEFLNSQMKRIQQILKMETTSYDSNDNSIESFKMLFKSFEEFDRFMSTDQQEQNLGIETPKKLGPDASEKKIVKKSNTIQKQILFEEEPKSSTRPKSSVIFKSSRMLDSTNNTTSKDSTAEDAFKKRLQDRQSNVLKSVNIKDMSLDSSDEGEKLSRLEEKRRLKKIALKMRPVEESKKSVTFDFISTSNLERSSSKPQPNYMSSTASASNRLATKKSISTSGVLLNKENSLGNPQKVIVKK